MIPATVTAAASIERGTRRQLLITGPGRVEFADEVLPPLHPGHVLAVSLLSGISHGTESAWLSGHASALYRRWNPAGRHFVNEPGRAYPIAPGYECVARIAAVGPGVTAVAPGDLVALDRPHADAHIVTEQAAAAGVLPAGLNPARAVFFVLARVALGGVHDAQLSLGDTVVVVGLGTVGLLAAQQARLSGAKVIGIDRYALRVNAARGLGIEAILSEQDTDCAIAVRDLAGPHGADAAIEASGSYSALHEAIRSVRPGGRVVTVSSYHGNSEGLRLGEEYHRNRVTLLSSMTVNGCRPRDAGWDLDRLNQTAREQVVTGTVHVDPLITHRVPFTDAADAYRLITDAPHETIKVVLTYDQH
ncbi:oxidoreductase [Actinoplanes capillaceus]|uniref:Oxidoreductase n=1 Tax=Actinoplanes campanulatus TaxID=113559 RepID=A0ABQ3WZ10_9ACTN|nr:zinc-binding alcohol dehydrogenase [Actinoplanes capillaceus]GID51520.1 oxidoreductase [Actinoplanes capillaceus]